MRDNGHTPTEEPDEMLAPITKTFSHTISRDGRTRRECWSATTADGVWGFDRLEMPGTPWELVHTPTQTPCGWYGTLKSARQVAANMTDEDITRAQEENR